MFDVDRRRHENWKLRREIEHETREPMIRRWLDLAEKILGPRTTATPLPTPPDTH